VQEALDIFKALSDETRLRIIKLLEGGELCVCDIVAAIGMIQPKVSFHLASLKDAGLIADRKEGRWTRYRLRDSDMFRRFLLYAAIEKTSGDAVEEDKKRLEEFLRTKGNKVVELKKCS